MDYDFVLGLRAIEGGTGYFAYQFQVLALASQRYRVRNYLRQIVIAKRDLALLHWALIIS